jgi:hypothetical protein
MKDLQGDRPVVPEIVGEIDRSHAAAAELALDHVTITESAGELLVDQRRTTA